MSDEEDAVLIQGNAYRPLPVKAAGDQRSHDRATRWRAGGHRGDAVEITGGVDPARNATAICP
ncbi:hypothetical protein HGG75_23420 [Ochrobactrum pseudogrignonense]|nr:hypothetical protein [Brucella pseudogrignonensis]